VLFSGFLDRTSGDASSLELRLWSGRYWPDSGTDQILYVVVEKPNNFAEVQKRLSEIEPYETELLVEEPATPTQLTIRVEYAEPLLLRGHRVMLRRTDFELLDYKRFLQLQQEQLDSLHGSVKAATLKIADARGLLSEQARRVLKKSENHPAGNTARTLYDQQLAFITRVLGKLDA
jgi:hypothetical protein